MSFTGRFEEYVTEFSPTRRGSQLLQSAQDRMMSRKPTARKNERNITAM
jgi:hypothetical protein